MPNSVDKAIADSFHGRDRISGVDAQGGFSYNLNLTYPCIATAIHAGHRMRDELVPFLEIPEALRLAEEDVATDELIAGCPSTICGRDSRAEYDLNRPAGDALPLTPEKFWGIRVFHAPPTEEMNRKSLAKHERFYRFVADVVGELLNRFGVCLVYDIHSYNIFRQLEKGHPSPPLFNLGTRLVDRNRWRRPVDEWIRCLRHVSVPGVQTSVAENDVFEGRGEFAKRLMGWDRNILVLPTEVSKRYMDEKTGVVHWERVASFRSELARAVSDHCRFFYRSCYNEPCRST